MKIYLRDKIKYWTKIVLEFIFNPRLLLCFGLAWIITNGWAYIALTIGTWLKISWLAALASTYLMVMWFPFTPEKIVTIVIAIFLLKLLFPNDKKTLEKLYKMKEKVKTTSKQMRDKYKRKKSEKNNDKSP